MSVRFVWDDFRVDRAHYEEIAGQLHGLLIRLDDRLPGKDVTLIAEFIDVGELGLALEQMADVLSEDERPLTPDERATCLPSWNGCRWATASHGRWLLSGEVTRPLIGMSARNAAGECVRRRPDIDRHATSRRCPPPKGPPRGERSRWAHPSQTREPR